jgi:hypothetical protein
MSWRALDRINRGTLYRRMEELPKRYDPRKYNLATMTNPELVELQREIEIELAHRTW